MFTDKKNNLMMFLHLNLSTFAQLLTKVNNESPIYTKIDDMASRKRKRGIKKFLPLEGKDTIKLTYMDLKPPNLSNHHPRSTGLYLSVDRARPIRK